ncbi:hypothetical protein D3C85_1751490 [compost metagenome]
MQKLGEMNLMLTSDNPLKAQILHDAGSIFLCLMMADLQLPPQLDTDADGWERKTYFRKKLLKLYPK